MNVIKIVDDESHRVRGAVTFSRFVSGFGILPDNRIIALVTGKPHESLKEVLSKGVSLGETQSKLLQKIEELTLYMIQAQKQQTAQNQAIQALMEENGALKQRMMVLEQQQQSVSLEH